MSDYSVSILVFLGLYSMGGSASGGCFLDWYYLTMVGVSWELLLSLEKMRGLRWELALMPGVSKSRCASVFLGLDLVNILGES